MKDEVQKRLSYLKIWQPCFHLFKHSMIVPITEKQENPRNKPRLPPTCQKISSIVDQILAVFLFVEGFISKWKIKKRLICAFQVYCLFWIIIFMKFWYFGFKDSLLAWNWTSLQPQVFCIWIKNILPCIISYFGRFIIQAFPWEGWICHIFKTFKNINIALVKAIVANHIFLKERSNFLSPDSKHVIFIL